MKKSPKYLHQRYGKWYVRVPIPKQLQKHFGKSQFREFLSEQKSEAERKSHHYVANFLDQIERAKRGELINSLKPHEYFSAFYDRYLPKIAKERGNQLDKKDDYIENEFHKLEHPSKSHLTLGELEKAKAKIETVATELFDMTWSMRRKLLQKVEHGRAALDEIEAINGWAIDELISRKELPSTITEKDRIDIAQKLASVELMIMKTVDDRETPEAIRKKPDSPLFKDSGIITTSTGTTLEDILPTFHAHREVATTTEKEHRTAVRYFYEYLETKKAVSEITVHDIRGFRGALLDLPTNYIQRFPNKTLPEAIKANKARSAPFPTINSVTINKKYLSHLRNIFGFALEEGLIDINPAERVKVDNRKKSKAPTRIPFQQPDLDLMFSHGLFKNPKSFDVKQWAILLALYTGARSSSEISKLSAKDVFKQQDIWVIHFAEGSKNENAVHTVPIHKRLIELGFLKYVDRQRKNKDQLLFPKWYGNDKVNRWFNRTFLKKELNIDDKRKVFHSFRHTLKTALTNAGVPYGIRDKIIPHAQEGAAAIYDHSTNKSMMSHMQRELNKVVFESVSC